VHVVRIALAPCGGQVNFFFRGTSPEVPMGALHMLVQEIESVDAVVTESASVSAVAAMSLDVSQVGDGIGGGE